MAKSKDAVLLIDGSTGETTQRYPLAARGRSILCADRFVVRSEDRDLVSCLHLGTGQVLWERELFREMGEFARFDFKANAIGMVPGTLPGRFIVTRSPMIFGVSLEDGSLRWAAPVTVGYCDPNVHEGRIYVLLMDAFLCLDEATGQAVYATRPPQLAGAFLPRPGTIYGGKIAFAMESGHLAVFDLADGHLTWLYKHKVKLWSTTEADGRLLVTTDDGHLLVFEENAR